MNKDYIGNIRKLLDKMEETQNDTIDKVAEVCAECIANNGLLYFFGTGHSHMIAEEPFYRAGGLANISPLLTAPLMLHESATASSIYERTEGLGKTVVKTSTLKAGEVIFLASNSGRNPAIVDAALQSKAMGAITVAITSLNHSKSVTSRHSSGKRLFEVCDYVLDNGGCPGDACVSLEGLKGTIAPTSSVIDLTIVNTVIVTTAEKLIEKGVTPTVFMSANLDGGDKANAEIIANFKPRVAIL